MLQSLKQSKFFAPKRIVLEILCRATDRDCGNLNQRHNQLQLGCFPGGKWTSHPKSLCPLAILQCASPTQVDAFQEGFPTPRDWLAIGFSSEIPPWDQVQRFEDLLPLSTWSDRKASLSKTHGNLRQAALLLRAIPFPFQNSPVGTVSHISLHAYGWFSIFPQTDIVRGNTFDAPIFTEKHLPGLLPIRNLNYLAGSNARVYFHPKLFCLFSKPSTHVGKWNNIISMVVELRISQWYWYCVVFREEVELVFCYRSIQWCLWCVSTSNDRLHTPFAFQSGISSFSALGSIQAPLKMWAPKLVSSVASLEYQLLLLFQRRKLWYLFPLFDSIASIELQQTALMVLLQQWPHPLRLQLEERSTSRHLLAKSTQPIGWLPEENLLWQNRPKVEVRWAFLVIPRNDFEDESWDRNDCDFRVKFLTNIPN